jgi:hypothetical protein
MVEHHGKIEQLIYTLKKGQEFKTGTIRGRVLTEGERVDVLE